MAAGRTLANGLKTAGITRVDVVGLAESHCVKETALDAKKLGSKCMSSKPDRTGQ